MQCYSLLETFLTGMALVVLFPVAWFAIGPVWGPLAWLLLVFIVCGNVMRILICVGVAYLIYSMVPAHAQTASGWGAFDSSRNEIYMGKLFNSVYDCKVNLDRYFPKYGKWECRWVEMVAPNTILVPPHNAKDGVRCSKNGGTTVCR